jgi:hypothetical protein
MSGSGGGDGGGGGGESGFSCSTLRYKTTLNSPVPTVITYLKPKDILNLEQRKKPDGPLYAVAKGHVAGTIAGAMLIQLLKCIEDGFEYEAVVIKVVGGNVEVEVRPRGT